MIKEAIPLPEAKDGRNKMKVLRMVAGVVFNGDTKLSKVLTFIAWVAMVGGLGFAIFGINPVTKLAGVGAVILGFLLGCCQGPYRQE